MITVPLAPTASIARHEDHRTDANPGRWLALRITSKCHLNIEVPARYAAALLDQSERALSPERFGG
jgi:hypothetical protein